MKTLLLKNADIILPDKKLVGGSVLVEAGRISRIFSPAETASAETVIDLAGAALYPGFIDIHIHGAVGVDVMTAATGDLEKMAVFLAGKGITGWMPTFVPDCEENYRTAIAAIDKFISGQKGRPVAQILGVHYEGPFVNEKQCGALRPEFFRSFEKGNELSFIPTLASDNAKRLMTLAPEVTGGIDLIKELRRNNWIVSIGHTRAGVKALDSALGAGARHMTHFFNAMSGLHHRELDAVGWGLMNDDVTCDVIADGVHVHPEMLKLLHRAKSSGRLTLISDSVLPAGLGDGEYKVWGEKISVKNGKTQNERERLAGSVITMLDAVKMMLTLGIDECEVAEMASMNPARLLGLEKERGSIEEGKLADLVALNAKNEVQLVIVGGDSVIKPRI